MALFLIGAQNIGDYLGLNKLAVKKLAREPGFPVLIRNSDQALVTTREKLDRWANSFIPEPGPTATDDFVAGQTGG